jgi:hypothetical protein
MVGFFSGLSPEQKKAALDYKGADHHGDSKAFCQKPA